MSWPQDGGMLIKPFSFIDPTLLEKKYKKKIWFIMKILELQGM